MAMHNGFRLLPELEEPDGGEAGNEKASNDDRKATFLLASIVASTIYCNKKISYFSVAVFSCNYLNQLADLVCT